MVVASALVLGIAAGFLLRRDDVSRIRFGWLGIAVAAAFLFTTALVVACAVDLLPYDIPVRSQNTLMILTGIYQSAGALLALISFPWAPIQVRLKTAVAILSGGLIVGWRIYGDGDLMLFPAWQEHVANFAMGGTFAAVAVTAGLLLKSAIRRMMAPREV